MRISVLQENLRKGLSIVSKAVESKPQLPVLANILLVAEGSELRLAATNLQLSITANLGARVEESGSITLPAKTFTDLVNNLSPERVDLNLDTSTNSVNVRCGATHSNIKGIDADEFPPITHGENSELLVNGKTLKEMINQTAFAAATDDNRPILTGVNTQVEGGYTDDGGGRWLPLSSTLWQISHALRRERRYGHPLPKPCKKSLAPSKKTTSKLASACQANAISSPSTCPISTSRRNCSMGASLISAPSSPSNTSPTPSMYTTDLLRACKRAEIFARDSANSGRLHVKPPKGPSEPGRSRHHRQEQRTR
jgi:DNA polymerase-3 subunit beta